MNDDETLAYLRTAVGREHGLNEQASRRLVGSTLSDLHDDARVMANELGLRDPSERARDDGGRFAGGGDMNRIIRQASGRA